MCALEVSHTFYSGTRRKLLKELHRHARESRTGSFLGAPVGRGIGAQAHIEYGSTGVIALHDEFPFPAA